MIHGTDLASNVHISPPHDPLPITIPSSQNAREGTGISITLMLPSLGFWAAWG